MSRRSAAHIAELVADGTGVLRPAVRVGDIAMLSFRDLAEAYVLMLLTKFYRFGLPQVREMMDIAKEETGLGRPLIEADLRILFRSLILEKKERGRQSRESIDLSGHRNLVFPEFVDQLGKRVVRDGKSGPLRIYPWRLTREADESRPVSLDPEVVSGRLVVTGTRIPVQVLLGRKRAGSSDEEIARSYRISADSVRKALQHRKRQYTKAA